MTTRVGPKSQQLQKLERAGFNVPEFLAFTNEDMKLEATELAERVLKQLPAKSYAVRSSAFTEDTSENSMAGQFTTRLAVGAGGLAEAIEEVREDGKKKLGDLKKFSLLVQEYVEADYAGVAFTRNPSGSREFVIEYVHGPCEDLVSGKVRPERLLFYRSEKIVQSKLPQLEKLRKEFLKIEQLFDSPQDIEWLIKNKKLFILQSRPITTLTEDQLATFEYLDQNLPSGKFFFEKTGVSDVAPRPTPLTFSLLKKIYAEDGPVDRVYRKFGLRYQSTDFLKIIGNELYIDKEKELHSLFPSHSFFVKKDLEPSPASFKGFIISSKNAKRLLRMEVVIEELVDQLKEKLSAENAQTLKGALKHFLEDYELIFEINLAAEQNMQRLSRALPEGQSISRQLSMNTRLPLPEKLAPPKNLLGNTLEFTDESKFQYSSAEEPSNKIQSDIDEKLLAEVQSLELLREYGRWLAIKHINVLRELALNIAGKDYAYFTLNELLASSTSSQKAQDRQKQYKKGDSLTLPLRLIHKVVNQSLASLGVSAGEAKGRVVTEDQIAQVAGAKILAVHTLRPDLTQYQDKIVGVISENGGLLSHFAIIAREMKLPVVVQIEDLNRFIGREVRIDGETGQVKELLND